MKFDHRIASTVACDSDLIEPLIRTQPVRSGIVNCDSHIDGVRVHYDCGVAIDTTLEERRSTEPFDGQVTGISSGCVHLPRIEVVALTKNGKPRGMLIS